MKQQDEFNEWLKRQVEENPELPPEAAWQQIAEHVDLESAWEGIQQELDLEQLWPAIDKRLQLHQQQAWWETAAGVVATLSVLLAGVLFALVPYAQEQERTAVLPQDSPYADAPSPVGSGAAVAAPGEKEIAASGNISAQQGYPVAGATAKSSTAHQPSLLPSSSVYQKGETAMAGVTGVHAFAAVQQSPRPEEHALAEFVPLAAGQKAAYPSRLEKESAYLPLSTVTLQLPVIPALAMEEEAPVVPEARAKRRIADGWRLGAAASVRMSWLLNQKTYQAMEKSSLTTSLPSFRKGFSLQAEKALSPKLALITDLVLHSESGQRYKEYQQGLYGTTNTQLNYSGINLQIGYAAGSAGVYRKPYQRITAGVSAAWLRQATEDGPAGEKDLTDEYRRNTAGILLGVEHLTPLGRNWWLSYGFRTQLDAFNIYKGNSQIPADFRYTRGASLDFTIGVKYDLKNN